MTTLTTLFKIPERAQAEIAAPARALEFPRGSGRISWWSAAELDEFALPLLERGFDSTGGRQPDFDACDRELLFLHELKHELGVDLVADRRHNEEGASEEAPSSTSPPPEA